MNFRHAPITCCLLLSCGSARAGLASWDEMQLRLLEQYSTPLRWDNVEGPPCWVSGPRPRHQFEQKSHLIELEAGQEVMLRASASTWLRLVGAFRTLRAEDLEIGVSTDGRAFVEINPIKTIDPYSMLVELPQDQPSLVRLTRPHQAASNLLFAAYLSRVESHNPLAPLREIVHLPGEAVRVRRVDEAAAHSVRLLEPGEDLELVMRGPARLQLVARLRWPVSEPRGEQPLVLMVALDDADPAPLRLCPEPDTRLRTRVAGSTTLVSHRLNGFFNVPEGKHRLRIQSSAVVLLSVFRQSKTEFLLPWLNGPATNAMQWAQSILNVTPTDSASSFEFFSGPWSSTELVRLEQEAQRLSRNNQVREASAQAADWLERLSQSRADDPAGRRGAEALWRQRATYREVVPASLPGDQLLTRALFTPSRLRSLFEPSPRIAVFDPTLEQVDQLLSEGHFAPVPPRLSPGLLYELPSRAHDSKLRLAVLASAAERTRLLIQFDQENPIKVSFDATTALPRDIFDASDALATLRVFEQEAQLSANLASGFPFGEFDLPAPVLDPSVVELPLPQHVRQVRIYLTESSEQVRTSVAYRAAKPFEFGEAAYRSLLNQFDAEKVMQMLAGGQDSPGSASELLRELSNHLQPLARRLRAHFNDFTNNIEVVVSSSKRGPDLDTAEVSSIKLSALNLEQAGRLLEAIELWNRLYWEGPVADREEAALAIVRCLRAVGEEFLAAQYARYALLNSKRQQIPTAAVEFLESTARQTDDAEQLEQLRAFLFLRCPCAQHLAGLCEALFENGQEQFALYAGLILPRESRPAEPLLHSALHEDWWQTFDELVEQMSDHQARSFWRAQKHLAFYQFVAAEQELDQAGELGRDMLAALRQGMRIRQQLSSSVLVERLEAVRAWEQWQLNQPGPKTWQTADDVEQDCSFAESLFNVEQDRFTACLRAEPERPVKLRFLGPIRLQLEVRPMLESPYGAPVDDWLQVVEYGMTNRIPVSQSVPNPSLQFTTSRNALPGVKTVASMVWGPGWHEVQVSLAKRRGLIRVLQEQPLRPTRILPTLNSHRLNLVIAGQWPTGKASPKSRATKQGELWWLPSDENRALPSGILTTPKDGNDLARRHASDPADLSDVEMLRLNLRRESEPGSLFAYDPGLLQSLPPAEQWLAACRGNRPGDFTNWAAVAGSARGANALAAGRVHEVLDSDTPRDALQRLTTLLEVAELFPAGREAAQCLAESLAAGSNCPAGGRRILSRLTQDRTWLALNVSPLSAGVKPLQVPSDLPQDPHVQLRRALLPPARTNQFTISGQTMFTASMVLQHPARVRLHAELVKAGFSPALPITAALQIDGSQPTQLSLVPPVSAAETNFMLNVGAHLIRTWIVDPAANQFVRLTVSGTSEASTNAVWSRPLAEMASERRFFHAATQTQPVRFSWKGPALLRVDEYREGRFLSQLRYVPSGEQTVEIGPAPGLDESWYQIFVRGNRTNQIQIRLASSIREPEEVPPPVLRLPESKPITQVQLQDYYRLGGQEDGTWTPGVLLAHRRPFEISSSQDNVENEFLEASLAYRKASPGGTLWFRTEALGRWHRPGDLTFGLSERVEGHPSSSPFDWSWLGEGFVGTAGSQQQEVQWSLHTGLELGVGFQLNRKLEWRPVAALFAHEFSLDSTDILGYDYIDQDLYTSFRDDHRWGGVLGSQLEYKPWLDSRLEGDVYLMSNENFTPDNCGLRFAWTQLLGPVRGEVAYLARYFLNDADRSSASWIQGFSTSLFAEWWLSGRHRIEFGAQFRHDWPDLGNSYFLTFKWDFSQGRRYRDYAPRETVFRDLRSRRLCGDFNNLLTPEPPGLGQP